VKLSFGKKGGLLFAFLNVLQLVGWTAIMIYDGALATNGIFDTGAWVWCLVIGALILVWILIGITNLGWVNRISMAALFILTLVLCKVIFIDGRPGDASAFGEAMSFGAAVELAVAMPLSWLPLISDYTREAEKPFRATLASTLTYGLVSCWMYIIGMGAAIYTGEGDIALIMVKAGLGVAALVILILSTVTTTFLDAWSAGISSESLSKKLSGKWVAVGVTVIGTAAAMLFPMDDITDFLYLIGSVFAPMIAVQLADFFILRRPGTDSGFDWAGLGVWLAGFVIYRLLMNVDFVLGNTLPDMLITMALCVLVRRLLPGSGRRAS
ncbi:MAG: putative hydroxymethylpyrimidine transporter CytX, partial [Oscillospiraceae bacterium]|nr:putative hydroxymethylpyrimidine transporter CytX [Oscillospiraceae bacterium]